MHKRFKAFTLIELLVVIAIVGILSGFIFVSMSSAVNSAKDAKRKADLSTISKAILAYMAENNNAYPYTASTSTCNLCNNDSCTNPCTGFYANIQPYLSNIPLDPNGSTYYTYTYSATPKFVLQTTLSDTYVYQYDSTSGFSTLSYSSTCTAATNAKVSCTPITISSTEEACQCTYLSGDGTTTWTTPNQVTQVQYLVIGGGGGGANTGSGGGAGGYLTGTMSVSGNQTLTVGNGGAGGAATAASGTKGGDSVFGSVTAEGGGEGISHFGSAGGNGGSGGGGPMRSESPASTGGTASAGYPGGAGVVQSSWYGGNSGGGGAGGPGIQGTTGTTNPSGSSGSGGPGKASSITGTSITRAGGGAGGEVHGASVGSGGSGGGGGSTVNGVGLSGTNNTGSGGGGGSYYNGSYYAGGAGGSGIVILKYFTP